MSRWAWLTAITFLYLVPSGVIAGVRPLWHDEIFTLYLSRLPSMHDVWTALSIATDLIPPFFYVITRACVGLLGESNLVLRVPELLGSWVMALCIFRFVERRGSTTDAGLAALFPSSTLASLYVYEGRPTAIVGAFAGLALLAWQAAGVGWRGRATTGAAAPSAAGRAMAIMGLAASLMAAVAVHYYALLLPVPFVIAELARSWRAGRMDLPVYVAIMLAPLPLLVLRPQVSGGLAYATAFWSRPFIGTIVEFYQLAYGPASGVFVALLVVAGLVPVVGRTPAAVPDEGPAFTMPETLLAAGLASMPIAAVLLALVTLPIFSPRYVLWSVIGASVLFAGAARRLFGARAWASVLVAVVIAGGLLRGNFRAYNEARSQRADLAALVTFLRDKATLDVPLVVVQPAEFLELHLIAPPDLASRLVYLVDSAASIRRTQQDTADRALLSLSRFARLHVEPYEVFRASQPRFQAYVRDGRGWWLMGELPDRAVQIRARRGAFLLWDVDLHH